jgi:tetratricopeptide (TPR) repeat protein
VTGPRIGPVGRVLVFITLVAAFVGLQVWRDAVYGEPAPGEAVLYVRSGDAMRRAALGFAPLLADVYWVRAVQYYGATRLSTDKHKRYDLLYPLLDITTSLDPRFNIAYRFGSIFLTEAYPGGAGRPDQAIQLLEKGFRASPARWHYLQDIGFVYYWWLGDYRQAGEWFTRASKVPGAPWWMQSLAAATLAQGGDRQHSRRLWQAMYDTAENDWMRSTATLRIAQLDALDAIDQLTAAASEFKARTGAYPASWDVLVRARMIRAVPLDASGAAFVLDPQTGSVMLAPGSPLGPLPAGSQAARAPGGER